MRCLLCVWYYVYENSILAWITEIGTPNQGQCGNLHAGGASRASFGRLHNRTMLIIGPTYGAQIYLPITHIARVRFACFPDLMRSHFQRYCPIGVLLWTTHGLNIRFHYNFCARKPSHPGFMLICPDSACELWISAVTWWLSRGPSRDREPNWRRDRAANMMRRNFFARKSVYVTECGSQGARYESVSFEQMILYGFWSIVYARKCTKNSYSSQVLVQVTLTKNNHTKSFPFSLTVVPNEVFVSRNSHFPQYDPLPMNFVSPKSERSERYRMSRNSWGARK